MIISHLTRSFVVRRVVVLRLFIGVGVVDVMDALIAM